MDPQTIGLITTSIISVIAALAAAFSTVRKGQLDALNATIAALEKRVSDLEADLASERTAHKATREELIATYEELSKYRRAYGALAPKGAS